MLTVPQKWRIQRAGAVSGSCLSLSKIEKTRKGQQQEDYEKMNQSRAQLIEWIIFKDYGTKDARKSGELPEALEAYGLPYMTL